MEKALPTVHWKKYLDINNGNPQVRKFLESRGDDVLWQISQNIQRANRREMKSLVMVIHENAPSAILIERADFQNVLDLSLKWFESRELYERCGEIVEFKNYMKSGKSNNKKKTNSIKLI